MEFNEHQAQSFDMLERLEKLMIEDRDEEEEENEIEKIFLGWIQKRWMQADNKSSNKRWKIAAEERAKRFADSWDERNSQIHTEKMQVKNLKRRIEELHGNENDFDIELKKQ